MGSSATSPARTMAVAPARKRPVSKLRVLEPSAKLEQRDSMSRRARAAARTAESSLACPTSTASSPKREYAVAQHREEYNTDEREHADDGGRQEDHLAFALSVAAFFSSAALRMMVSLPCERAWAAMFFSRPVACDDVFFCEWMSSNRGELGCGRGEGEGEKGTHTVDDADRDCSGLLGRDHTSCGRGRGSAGTRRGGPLMRRRARRSGDSPPFLRSFGCCFFWVDDLFL